MVGLDVDAGHGSAAQVEDLHVAIGAAQSDHVAVRMEALQHQRERGRPIHHEQVDGAGVGEEVRAETRRLVRPLSDGSCAACPTALPCL